MLKLLFIAFKIIQGNSNKPATNHFIRAKNLIGITFASTLFIVIYAINKYFNHPIIIRSAKLYFGFLLACLVISFIFNLYYKKAHLAKAILLYKSSFFEKYALVIGFLYFITIIVSFLFLAS